MRQTLKQAVRGTPVEQLARRAYETAGRKGRRRRRQAGHDRRAQETVRRIMEQPCPPFPPDEFLQGRHTRPPVTKRGLILELSRGRAVLDIGCVQHSWRMSLSSGRWLHRRIQEVASTCTGVDFLDQDVQELNQRGFDMVCSNVLTDPPPGQYDVVVAGDVIEHVENPKRFLEYVSCALKPGGMAVITTPNAFYVGYLWTVLARGRPDLNPEHVLIFDPKTFAALLERSGLRVREWFWLEPSWRPFWDSDRWVARVVLGQLLAWVDRAIISWRPYLSSDFAAVLEHRTEADGAFDAQASAAAAMAYHSRASREHSPL